MLPEYGIFTESALGPLRSSSRDVRGYLSRPLPMQLSQGSEGGPRGAKQSPIVASIPLKNVPSLRLAVSPPFRHPPLFI